MTKAQRAQRARKHEKWLKEGRVNLQQQPRRFKGDHVRLLKVTRQLLMLLTLEPHLLQFLHQRLQALPSGSKLDLCLDFCVSPSDQDCQDPPDDEALDATAMELALIVSSLESVCRLDLKNATAFIMQVFLTACPRLQHLGLVDCLAPEAVVQDILSIKSLTKVTMYRTDFPSSESINAFCRGIESSSLTSLVMNWVSFSPEHSAQVATTLARSNSLVNIIYLARAGESRSFFDDYCAALSNYFDTKLEWLSLCHGEKMRWLELGRDENFARGIDAAMAAKIRYLLELNVQRKTCPPLFAAIRDADTDTERKQCLVEALETVDIPVVFEYITANQNNLIELIQRLGRSNMLRR